MFNIFTTLLAIGVVFAVIIIIYSFLGVFIHNNIKKKIIITTVITLLGLAIYFYEDNKHVIYMKEDVMYIHPKGDTIRSNFK
jgi:hypothetical protein